MTSPIVVFIGAPASGKSKIARRVSALTGHQTIDTDKDVVAKYGPIVEIFDTQGEEAFRAYERDAVREALSQAAIVSLGGGAVLNAETQADLKSLPVVLLTVSDEAVSTRIGDPKRPLLRNGIAAWKDLVEKRMPIYLELAGLTIDTSDGDLDKAAQQVVSWIKAGYPREES